MKLFLDIIFQMIDLEYYYEVVLPMKYDNNVMKVINKRFSLYLPDIESGKGR